MGRLLGDSGAEKALDLASRASVNCMCPLGRWHMVSLADLSQPAGVTAVIAEMEMHFCASRLLAEHAPGSFPQHAEEQGEISKGGFMGEGRSGWIIFATHQLMQRVLAISCCAEVQEEGKEKEKAWSKAGAVCEGGEIGEGRKMNGIQY